MSRAGVGETGGNQAVPLSRRRPDLSVLVPAHNEDELLASTVDAIVSGLRRRGLGFELVIIENGSTDDTQWVAASLAARHPEVHLLVAPVADYGEALRTGLSGASGNVVAFFDVDYYSLSFLDQALFLLAQPAGPGLVVGSKRLAVSEDNRPLVRRMITRVFGLVLRVVFGLALSDTHGIKAMRREAALEPAARCRFGGDLFDTELILRMERLGTTTAELPVVVREQRPTRTPILWRVLRCIPALVGLRLALWFEQRPDEGVSVSVPERGWTPRTATDDAEEPDLRLGALPRAVD